MAPTVTWSVVLLSVLVLGAAATSSVGERRQEELDHLYSGFVDDLFLEMHSETSETHFDDLNLSPEVLSEIKGMNRYLSPTDDGVEEEDPSCHYGSMDQGQGVYLDDVVSKILQAVIEYFRKVSWVSSLEYCEDMEPARAGDSAGAADPHAGPVECERHCKEQVGLSCTAWHYGTQCFVGDPMRCASDYDVARRMLRGVLPGAYAVLKGLKARLMGVESHLGSEELAVVYAHGERNLAAVNYLQWVMGWLDRAWKMRSEKINIPPSGIDAFPIESYEVERFPWITSVISGVMQTAANAEVVSESQGLAIRMQFQKMASVSNPAFKGLKNTPAKTAQVKAALAEKLDGNDIIPVLVDEATQRPLALQTRTTLFDADGGAMKATFIDHLKQAGAEKLAGFMFRSGKVVLGDGTDAHPSRIEVDHIEGVQRLIDARTAINAFGTNIVHPYEGFEGAFADETWKRAAHLFRALGYNTDEEYELGVVYRTAKPPSKLSYTREEYSMLAGTVWHKDVYATANVIFYPFCFLEGFDTEIVTRDMYEEIDPKSAHLGALPVEYVQFSDSITLKSFGDAAAGIPPTGATIAFQNDYTRHAAHPPMTITPEMREAAIQESIKYGGEGVRLPGDIVRVFLHFSLREKSSIPLSPMRILLNSDALLAAIQIAGPAVKQYYNHLSTEMAGYRNDGGFAEQPTSHVAAWFQANKEQYISKSSEYAEKHGARGAAPAAAADITDDAAFDPHAAAAAAVEADAEDSDAPEDIDGGTAGPAVAL